MSHPTTDPQTMTYDPLRLCVFATIGSMLRAWSSAAPTNMTVPAEALGASRSTKAMAARRWRSFIVGGLLRGAKRDSCRVCRR